MTDLDVSLRVRLAYDGAAARPAKADLEAIRDGAARIGAQAGPGLVARGLGEVGRAAAVTKVGLDDLTGAGRRLDAVAQSSRNLTGDLRGAGAAAVGAGAAMQGVEAAPLRLEDELAALLRPGAPAPIRVTRPSRDEPSGTVAPVSSPVLRAAASPAAIRPLPAAPAAVDRTIPRATAPAVPGSGDAYRDAKAEAHIAAMWPSAATPDHRAFVRPAQTNGGQLGTAAEQRAVEALGRSAEALGAGSGARRLAEGIAAVSPAATEARRHIDDVATAAQHAERAAERLARTARAAGGGAGGSGGGGEGGPGTPAPGDGHKGPGGLRGALIAGARPLRMERLVMSAFTPAGVAGLAGGLGLAEVGRQLHAAEEQAASFEAAMVGVRRAAGDMPAEGVHELEKTILGVSTATGQSKEDIAQLTAAALRAGRPLADLPRFLDLGAKAAGVMGTRVDDAGARLVQLGRAWGKDQSGIEDTVDAVSLASEKTGAKSSDVLDFVSRHSDQRVRGMSARQVAAFGAGFQGAGLDAGQAEGAFSSLSEKLLNPQNASDQFRSTLNLDLDLNPSNARVGMRQDPTRTMVGVLDKLKSLPEGKRANVLGRMFGEEGGRDIGRIVDHLDQLKTTLGLVEDQGQRSGALGRAFKVFDDTTNAKIERAGRAVESFATKLGTRFLPAVKAAADGTARLFEGLGRFLDNSERADTILHKQMEGRPLTPEEQKDVDQNPRVRQMLGMDADPAATKAATERERRNAEAEIRALQQSARENGDDPQIKAMIEQAKRDYRDKFPGAPLPAFAEGGRVSGPGGPREDKVHALLSAGEFVVKASVAGKHAGLLTAINHDRLPAFANGGPVGPLAGAFGHDAEGEAMPARALARGLERGTAPDAIAAMVAKLSPSRDGRPATPEQIKTAIVEGTKAGIIAGLREMRDLQGTDRSRLLPISPEDRAGDGDASPDGHGGGRARPSLRYGGGYGPGGRRDPDGSVHRRSMRYRNGYGPRRGGGHPDPEHPERGDPGLHDGEGPRRPGRGADPRGRARRRGGGGDETPNADFQTEGNQIDGLTKEGTKQYAAILGKRESGNRYDTTNQYGYVGRWQMGADALAENGYVKRGTTNRGLNDPNNWTGKGGIHSVGEFKANKNGVQDREFSEYTNRHYAQLKKAGVIRDGMSQAEIAGWLAAGHLKGVGGAIKLSRGQDNVDANGTSASSYKNMMKRVGEGAPSPGPAPRATPPAPGAPPVPPNPPAPPPVAENPPPRRRRAAAAGPPAPAPARMAAGGRVVGPGGPREDRVPAMLSHGEFVVTAAAASKHPGLLAAINDDRVPAAAGGNGFTSARFSDPAVRPSPPRAADAGAGSGVASGGGGHAAGSPAPIQNFYGMHDPAVTARRAQQERNREVRRSQARALHSVGRIS